MKLTASVRGGKEEKIAYVVRWEPELENEIDPKRKKGMVVQRMFPVLFEIDGQTSRANPSKSADV